MGDVVAFPQRRTIWTMGEIAGLDRLTSAHPGAVGWEIEPLGRRAFITGVEDETLLIVTRVPGGIAVTRGWDHAPHWRGPSLERYA